MSKDKENMKVPKLRFPEFTNSEPWDQTTLSNVSEIVRGGSPRPIEEYITNEPNGLNWLKIGDVRSDSKFITSTKEKVIQEALNKTREVYPGDLILSNSMSFGRPYILKIKTCIHDGWIAITQISDWVNTDFLYYLILTPSSQIYFLNYSAGSGVQNLNADIIKLLQITVPKPAEQQKIASCLSSLDDLISAHTQKLDTLKTHKKGLMQRLFPAEGEKVPKLRFKEFKDSEEWEEKTLGTVAEIVTGNTPSTLESNNYIGDRMFVSPADITETRYIHKTKTTLSETGYSQTRHVKENSVLFVCIGSTIGKIAQNKYECATNQQINSLVVNEGYSSDFIYSVLENNASKIAELAGIQAVPIINKSVFSSVLISIPLLKEQQKIAVCLSSLDELITVQAEKTAQLKLHKKGLMQGLFPKTTN